MINRLAISSGSACTIHPEALTHYFHPYAAKFNPRIPCALLSEFSIPGQLILDPFAGSGTTLVEAMAHGCSAVGIDIHPLAALISRVKTRLLSHKDLQEINRIADWAAEVARAIQGITGLFDESIEIQNLKRDIPDFDNREHWFSKEAQDDLGILRYRIFSEKSERVKDFLLVAMSCVVLRASKQDSETRYKAIERIYKKGSAIAAFSHKILSMLNGIKELSQWTRKGLTCDVFNEDIRNQDCHLDQSSCDLVLTSPPYANTYDYYLYHKQRMNWIGLDFRIAKNREIGSRLEFSSQKAPVKKYFSDMEAAFFNVSKAMKKKARCIVIQGDSRIAGIYYSGEDTVRQIAKKVGLKYEFSSSVALSQNSKMFNPAFAAKGKKEHVIILRKN